MKTTLFKLVLLAFVLIACKKEKDPEQGQIDQSIPINEYFPLAIGNYWVYEFQTKLPSGEYIGNVIIDSINVIGDSIINDETFFVLTSNKPQANRQYYLRDSSGYIINNRGDIYLHPQPDTEMHDAHYGTFEGDTLYYFWKEYENDIVNIQSPLGNYECISQLHIHQMQPDFGGLLTIDSNYYSHIGILQRSYAFSSGPKMIGTLVEYHLEP